MIKLVKFGIIFFLFFLFNSLAFSSQRLIAPLKTDWTQSFYTDDSSYYLTLYPDGFKQKIRVNQDACGQISNISIVLKNTNQFNNPYSRFNQIYPKSNNSLYGINSNNYCWYEVETHGVNLSSTTSIKYVLKIQDNQSQNPFYFKGISNSLIPLYRLSDSSNIDYWIDLGNFGATPVIGGGVFYKIWEPLSEAVHLFVNGNNAVVMNAENNLNDSRRFHFIYLPNSHTFDRYHFQFVKNGQYENLEIANFNSMSMIKIDPMARELSYDKKGGLYNGFINPRGIVSMDNNPNEYIWRNDTNIKAMSESDFNNWIIYQLWPLTFNPKEVGGAFTQGKFSDVAEKIPYLNNLGINAVEFLPINISRFNASWGYALDSLLIVEDTLGSKADLKHLVDDLHGNNIRAIFDVVINHVNNSLLREPLTATQSSSKFYSGSTPWGPKPRFESVWVRKWIADSLIHMHREFHLDGFRFDMTDSIFNGTPAGYSFLQELNYLIKLDQPNFFTSAEQLPNNIWATYPISQNGLGFDAQWNDRFKNFFELEFDNYRANNRSVDLKFLSQAMMGFSDHEVSPGNYYSFGDPKRTVNYLGSHDLVGNKNPFVRIVTGYNSSEREDLNIFTRVNPLEESGDLRIPFRVIHNAFSHAAARVGYGILFTKPGASLFYQGEELAQDLNIENEWSYMNATDGNRFPSKDVNINKYVRSNRMPWYYYDLSQGYKIPELNFATMDDSQLFRGHLEFFKQMIAFKKANPEINNAEAVNVRFDNNLKILIYEIQTSNAWYFAIVNWGSDSGGTWVAFPGSDNIWWDEIINSSEVQFGGENGVYSNAFSNLGGRANLLRLKGPGFYLFKAMNAPTVKTALYFRSTLNNWLADSTTQFKYNSNNREEIYTDINIANNQYFEFKIGSKNWEIDLGQTVTAISQRYGESSLSYIPMSPNVKMNLSAGNYRVKFNLRTFNYSFEKL